MAKGNLFQGLGRGKVGDVVFSRLNGQQISRVRNRNPKNPKTAKQLYQRAIMATVMQAYSAGKALFDHSFQGLSVGSANQRAFLSENAKLLRQQIADALAKINDGTIAVGASTARVVAPAAVAPVPNGYLVSRGSYDQNIFTVDNTNTLTMPEATGATETLQDYMARVGFRPGDLYTLVLFVGGDSLAYETDDATGAVDITRSVKNAQFLYARLQVKPYTTDPVTAVSVPFSDVFVQTAGSLIVTNSILAGNTISIGALIPASVGTIASTAWGLIRSRQDSDLRSTSYLVAPEVAGAYGIAAPYITEIWSKGSQSLGDSDLILEGGSGE